jgi:hypothetical protein
VLNLIEECWVILGVLNEIDFVRRLQQFEEVTKSTFIAGCNFYETVKNTYLFVFQKAYRLKYITYKLIYSLTTCPLTLNGKKVECTRKRIAKK